MAGLGDLPRKQPQTLTVQGPTEAAWALLGNSWRGQGEFCGIVEAMQAHSPRQVALVDVSDVGDASVEELAGLLSRFAVVLVHKNGSWKMGREVVSAALQQYVAGGGGVVLLNGSNADLEFDAAAFLNDLEVELIADNKALGVVEVPAGREDHPIAKGMAGKPLHQSREIYEYAKCPEGTVILDSDSKLPIVFEAPASSGARVVSVNSFCVPWYSEGFTGTYERDRSCFGELIYRSAMYAASQK